MGNFGLISELLGSKSNRNLFARLIPDQWRYWFGPLPAGEILGEMPRETIQGWGWKLPPEPARFWDEQRKQVFWERLIAELVKRQIRVVGLDPGNDFFPPESVIGLPHFPGVSDGKALELLLFVKRFRRLVRNYGISPQKAKAMIVWEEGNLGIACARLIARELRFLTLVSPNTRLLERTAELIVYETGISPQIYSTPPSDFKGARIVIKCGHLSRLSLVRNSKRLIWCELFQSYPSLSSLNMEQAVAARTKAGVLPIFPALGETMIRAYFELNLGFWYGNDLPLERVFKLAVLLKEIGFDISV